MDLEEIIKYVKNTLSEERYYHSKCVMERCEELARKFDYDIEVARKVGIAHDIAKELTPQEKIDYCDKNSIKIDDMEEKNPSLLHGKIGADIAKKQFKFSESMCRAIEAHTTGLPNMDMLSKILFIADRTSEDRDLPDIEFINMLLSESIDKTILYILNNKIELQIKKEASIHINSIITRNWILDILK